MKEVIIVKYAELWLKSEPVRRRFISVLMSNIKQMLRECGVKNFGVVPARDMILIETKEKKKVIEILKNVFGISWLATAFETGSNFEAIEDAVLEVARTIPENKTFAIRASRSDKQLPYKSRDIEVKIGEKINRSVNLSDPDFTIYVEAKTRHAYVYTEKIEGPGGLPYRTTGKVLVLISGGIDSPVASWLMMRRGCEVEFAHFHPEVFAAKDNLEGIKNIVKRLSEYAPGALHLHVIPYSEIQSSIARNCERKATCILCRRIMYKIAEKLAKTMNAEAIVTGENLAQVASQTMDNLFVEAHALTMPVFRPLICFNKDETIKLAKKIGTYRLSVEASACCLLTPKRPMTSAKLEFIKREEKKIKNLDKLIENALKRRQEVIL